MAQDTLPRKLDDAADRVKQLVSEKNQAMDKMQSLQREANELRSLIHLAESKVDKMLEGGSDPPSSDRLEELKKRFPRAFTSDL